MNFDPALDWNLPVSSPFKFVPVVLSHVLQLLTLCACVDGTVLWVTIDSGGRTVPLSSQFETVTRRVKTCCSAVLNFCSFGSILNIKVSQVFCVQIFCSNVKPVELQCLII